MAVSTHSRPKAAGDERPKEDDKPKVSTHSRPKAAGSFESFAGDLQVSFNTQPPEGGWHSWEDMHEWLKWFQHTAARRRLGKDLGDTDYKDLVSTHSRPKAAGPKASKR